ncbi:hypothetical protein OOT46_00795 [Aquabacterium sp. A7-Y]|uniref:hypothetical protein n=1 Tax=Aquabacterium sp. A7-Y TaxID=1349605 RepID=UPI00223D5D67|nr:hypothetical protein [Aquabacterium sp. A7-Y]MCW7536391.1 hypothetical protein [Aquabacterium sp. A7-Y]
MHLLIPYASALSDACQHTLKDLQLPVLTQVLARLAPALRSQADEDSLSPPHERALARALGLSGPDGGLPWGAWLAARDGITTGDLNWALLTPAHWHVGTDQVTMLDPQTLQLGEEESRELLEAVRELFESEGYVLVWGAATRWYAAHESFRELPTASPDRVIGRNVHAWMPEHPQFSRVRRLQNEVQMLLYTHTLTDRRIERGLPPVNSFWLSGCGPAQPALDPPALVVDTRLRDAWFAEDWAAWAEAWHELERGPLTLALAALQRGAPVRLTLCGERSAQDFELRDGGWWTRLKQRWQRTQPADVLLNL